MDSGTLLSRLMDVRRTSEVLIEPLEAEDLCLQGMADASPPKWHLAHTTWFFETFVLIPHCPGYEGADPRWNYLFNSYYDAVGPRQPRPQRGLLSRPPMAGGDRLAAQGEPGPGRPAPTQRRFPLAGARGTGPSARATASGVDVDGSSRCLQPSALGTGVSNGLAGARSLFPRRGQPPVWLQCAGGLVEIGQDTQQHGSTNNAHPFHFDNEEPRHRVWLEPYALADRLVSNGDYRAFIEDGGYERPELWMSEGWAMRTERQWKAPRYWRQAQCGEQQRDSQSGPGNSPWPAAAR